MRPINLLMLLLMPLQLWAQPDAKSILQKMHQTLQSKKSISYRGSGKFKYATEDDTSKFSGTVHALKVPADSIFGAKVWVSRTNDSVYVFYDLSAIYAVNKNSRSVKTYNAHKEETWYIANDKLLNEGWFSMYTGREPIDTTAVYTLLHDTSMDNKQCYQVLVRYPDLKEYNVTDLWTLYVIDKKENLPLLVKGNATFQGGDQHSEFHITDYSFNKVQSSVFAKAQIPAGYKVEAYKEPVREKALLDSNSIAPLIAGKNYQKGMTADTIVYKGHITLLDFWYRSCIYCIKSLPATEEVRNKYAGNKTVQLWGVNSIDNNEKDLAKLPLFFEKNTMNYATVLVDKDISKMYKIQGWPAFYIIDQEGRVAFKQDGYSPTLAENLEQVIDGLLKK